MLLNDLFNNYYIYYIYNEYERKIKNKNKFWQKNKLLKLLKKILILFKFLKK